MNALDKQIVHLRARKDMLIALDRLTMNADFQKVIHEYYLKQHPLELVMLKGQTPLDPTLNASIDRQLDAVALFRMYLANTLDELPDIDLKLNEAIALRDEQTRNT